MVSIRSAASSGSSYMCYLLASSSPSHKQRTYVGVTNNLLRRLRQHNGHITGGAKATRAGRPWEVWITVEGFPDNQSCLQFEWMWKHCAPRKSHGRKARIRKLRDLLRKERWTEKAPLANTIPLSVKVYEDDFETTNEIIMNQWVLDELLGHDNSQSTTLPGYVEVKLVSTREEEETDSDAGEHQ